MFDKIKNKVYSVGTSQKQTIKRKGQQMSYNKFKKYAGIIILAIGFIYAGFDLVDRNPVLSIGVGILTLLLVESALTKTKK